MPNLLMTLAMQPMRRGRRPLRQVAVGVPEEVPSTDAVFIVLRRMRIPIIVLIVVFTISVAGLMLIPGLTDEGIPYRMTVFDAFYFMSYTATTIGFGETPYPFTAEQRLWVTASIYCSVIGWAYTFGTLFALAQDVSLREALAAQHFRRRTRRISEPFRIIAGYGHAGRLVGFAMDAAAHRFVVLDGRPDRVELLQTDSLHADVPSLVADARKPGVLGLAGLGHPRCVGVLALTDDDEVNLSIVMAVHLLRPDLPVIARCAKRVMAEHMNDFNPQAVINPYQRYAQYLVMALRRPHTFRVVAWLLSPVGSKPPPLRPELAEGRWMVCGNGDFGHEVAKALRRAGLDVSEVEPEKGQPAVGRFVGLVAGSDQDSINLAVAAHARRENAEIFLSVRQESHITGPLVTAFDFDSVFIPTEMVARECLARVTTPLYWGVVEYLQREDDAWATEFFRRMIRTCGGRLPNRLLISLEPARAPAVTRWLSRGHSLTLADLLRDPQRRDRQLGIMPLVLERDQEQVFVPDARTQLRCGDRILTLATGGAFDALNHALWSDEALEYVVTGHAVASTWIWRKLSQRRSAAPVATGTE